MKYLFTVASLTIALAGIYTVSHTNTLSGNASAEPPPRNVTGSYRVGLQIGHLENDNAPEELSAIRGNPGAQAEGKIEEDVNGPIAHITAQMLRNRGVTVDVLPATVPPGYTADAFISIHADQNPSDSTRTGYRSAPYAKDTTGKAHVLSQLIDRHYGHRTGLPYDPLITDAMRYYYAFSNDRFYHSVSSSTPSVIIETGYLPNPQDREIIVDNPHLPAQAIADAVVDFLEPLP